MNTKPFSGKAIYQPDGKAGEYAKYACNFYVGCSCGCTYCYNKKGRFKAAMGGDKPTLKKLLKNERHALEIFEKELQANLPELQKHGLFFSFATDPFLTETANLTMRAIRECHNNAIPVKTLTKRGSDDLVEYIKLWYDNGAINKNKIAFGFTLTGHDELEPNASTNAERIEAMKKLHKAGFKTFASIEPIIDIESSMEMIFMIRNISHLVKIGLKSGEKISRSKLLNFIERVLNVTYGRTDFDKLYKYSSYNSAEMSSGGQVLFGFNDGVNYKHKFKIYFKDSLLKAAGISRSELPSCCVARDYNIFNSK